MSLPAAHAAHVATMIPGPQLAWIPGLPLVAFTVLILFGRRLGRAGAWLGVAAMTTALGLTLSIAGPVFNGQIPSLRWAWLSSLDPAWRVGFAVDGLSWLMLFVVTVVGTCVQVYSIGYMHDDPRFTRFFAYLSLFCASMLGLVLADHYVLLFVCWELVGVCSYLLISFWFEKPAAANAGRKAFLTTRVGDLGLLAALLLMGWAGVSMEFSQLGAVRDHLAAHQPPLLTLISACFFLGAMGKSAQVPLHVWLPDAMEGPTSVSALIHAATMVAAGVYLVARSIPLFTPESLAIVFAIGLITHLLAGSIALVMTDIKKVLAYSTISQLGLMMTALGCGAVTAAVFHLYTHAFFKALMFLGAGSVIHATHTQELPQLGGLRKAMPWTGTMFLIASLSMAGGLFLSGFWSKDAILLAVWDDRPWAMWVLIGGATMTAAYVFRLYLRCFHGPEHAAPAQPAHQPHKADHGKTHAPAHHAAPHESPMIMVAPMAVLTVGALFAGLAGSPWLGQPLLRLLGEHHLHEGLDLAVLIWSTLALAGGFAAAWYIGFKRVRVVPTALQPLTGALYALAAHKYYVDEFYGVAIVTPFLRATQALARFDRAVIDALVDGTGRFGARLGQIKAAFDRAVVDGLVNGAASLVQRAGALLRWIQTGIVHQYLLGLVAGVVLLAVWLR